MAEPRLQGGGRAQVTGTAPSLPLSLLLYFASFRFLFFPGAEGSWGQSSAAGSTGALLAAGVLIGA